MVFKLRDDVTNETVCCVVFIMTYLRTNRKGRDFGALLDEQWLAEAKWNKLKSMRWCERKVQVPEYVRTLRAVFE